MSAPPTDWNDSHSGKAKRAFEQARNSAAKPPEKAVEAATGRDSEMVKRDKPAMNGPKPPGGFGQAVIQQKNKMELAKEAEGALKAQPPVSGISRKPVIELEHLEQGKRLHQKFQEAARKDRDKGR